MTNLTVPGCIQTCPIDRFYHLLKKYAIFDEKKLYKVSFIKIYMNITYHVNTFTGWSKSSYTTFSSTSYKILKQKRRFYQTIGGGDNFMYGIDCEHLLNMKKSN